MHIWTQTDIAWKNGDDGDLNDLGDNRWADLGDNNPPLGDISPEEENKDDGENREDAKECAGEGKVGVSCETEVCAAEGWGVPLSVDVAVDIGWSTMDVFRAVLASSLSRRSFSISTCAEQSPILNENMRPWGSTAPSLGLNFAESSRSITPRDRRNGALRGPT